MATEKEVEPSILVSKIASSEGGIPCQEDIENPTVEPTTPTSREGVDPIIEGPLLRLECRP